MMCLVALMKDAVVRQGDDVHGSTDERCCTNLQRDDLVALMNDTVQRTGDDGHISTVGRCRIETAR